MNQQFLAIFAKNAKLTAMGTMNISLPDTLRSFVDERVSEGAYSTSSEYLRELIRKEQQRIKLRDMMLEGATSGKSGVQLDSEYFDSLRKRAARR